MDGYLFSRFLFDRAEYEGSVEHWKNLWSKINPAATAFYRWRYPWLREPGPELRDGNPIFTAVSDDCRKAVRVIQIAPNATPRSADLSVWLDMFAGDLAEPDGVVELVIACVLSDTSSINAFRFMNDWVTSGNSSILPVRHDETAIPTASGLFTLPV